MNTNTPTPDLTADDFPGYFHAVHGTAPFPWQTRLTRQVLETGRWPSVLDLPTGSGKTSALDVALFTLACRPDAFPRRVVFVIDRRIIVDQVFERAAAIRDALAAATDGILHQVRNSLGVTTEEPLIVSALRGGQPITDHWSDRPDLPAIIVSTVDQYGSRLLHQGYGVSAKSRPIHAGLTGNDCLVLLDEVHLSRPFATTLRAFTELTATDNGLPRRYQVVEMSATPDDTDSGVFRLDDDDLADATLRQRITAPKHATLRTTTGKTKPPEEALPPAVLRILQKELHPEARTAAVVVNRVRTARKTYETLSDAGIRCRLLTGRMRPLDRAAILDEVLPSIAPDRGNPPEELTVVVATQAIEVGADFGFDALLTEAAPIDSLRQRFGRLDRRGAYHAETGQAAQAWILGVPKALAAPDPIYGDATRNTWDHLTRLADTHKDGRIPISTGDLRYLPANCSAPRQTAPPLLADHLTDWAQTWPQPQEGPEPAWYLQGFDRTADSDVNIVWRHDKSAAMLAAVPPRQAEYLPIPANAARQWLRQRTETSVSDTDQPNTSGGGKQTEDEPAIPALRWNGPYEPPTPAVLTELAPGDILIVDPAEGGISGGTWSPTSTLPATDLGDKAQWAHGGRVTLRLHPERLPGLPSVPRPGADDTHIREWLTSDVLPNWMTEVAQRLTTNGYQTHTISDHLVLTERHRPATNNGHGIITLAAHSAGVGQRAAEYATRIGLPTEVVADLRLAGRLHDLGKVDPRFQLSMCGGDKILAATLPEPIAKSHPSVQPGPHRGGYPKGTRHETASVALADRPEIMGEAHDPDLVLFLVGSHHGHGRPHLGITADPQPVELTAAHNGQRLTARSDFRNTGLAEAHTERYTRLVRRYGTTGLAWMEAVLRRADHRQSESEVG